MPSSHRIRLALCLFLIGFSAQLLAENTDTRHQTFFKANESYLNGDIPAALALYTQLLNQDLENGTLFYNIGNCYFRLQQIGLAIAFYKAALLFTPREEDLIENLRYVRTLTKDQIEENRSYRLFWFFYNKASRVELAVLAFIFSILFWLILIFRRFKESFFLSRGVAVVFFVLALFTLFSLYFKPHHFDTFNEGVITASMASVYSANSDTATRLFDINEGAEVKIKDDSQEHWVRIYIEQNKQGWVRRGSIASLKDLVLYATP
jgi:tetratricopeptide (TPR) repeat protein